MAQGDDIPTEMKVDTLSERIDILSRILMGLQADMWAMREILYSDLVTRIRQSGDPVAFVRKISESIDPGSETDIQALVRTKIDETLASIRAKL